MLFVFDHHLAHFCCVSLRLELFSRSTEHILILTPGDGNHGCLMGAHCH